MGTLAAERVTALELTGIAAAGSGISHDLRRDQPYGGYQDLSYEWPEVREDFGDVAARARAAVEDCAQSLEIARAACEQLGATSSKSESTSGAIKPPRAAAEAETRIEGPHGPVTMALTLTPELTITNLRVETPATHTLAALPEALEGRLISQAAAIVASLDLCMECLDF